MSSAGFMDLHWPGTCIVEMKAPAVPLRVAKHQVERYWRESSDFEAGVTAAKYVVMCNFHSFEVWQPGDYPNQPVATFDLSELPERYDNLAFLAGPTVEPTFTEHYRALTVEAAKTVAEVFHSLVDRSAAPARELHRFVLQSVWCMFAEDLGMLDGYPFQATLNEVRSHPERSEAELDLLLRATEFDWRRVNPTIFGSLLEAVLGRDRRWEIGAHYTHEVDIMKIVTPTIVRPWRERIDAMTTPTQARELLDELCRFRVLDPACGCGNFLYVAYRELRGLEHDLKRRIRALAEQTGLEVPVGAWPYYPLTNLQGLDIESSAVEIAKVTLWMGHRQMIDLYGEAEPPLPLQTLAAIRQADALRTPWPETDAIIGNPPFLGARFIRPSFNDDYADWLIDAFGIGVKDFCVYWFRKAQQHLKVGQRAGLVGTNSISQTGGRTASLQYIVDHGGVITDAVSSQKRPGDAKVHVSLVNWVNNPNQRLSTFTLDGVAVSGISTRLQKQGIGAEPEASRLTQNMGRCFAGVVPQARGSSSTKSSAHRC